MRTPALLLRWPQGLWTPWSYLLESSLARFKNKRVEQHNRENGEDYLLFFELGLRQKNVKRMRCGGSRAAPRKKSAEPKHFGPTLHMCSAFLYIFTW